MKILITQICFVSLLFCNCSTLPPLADYPNEKTNQLYEDKDGKNQLIGYTTKTRLSQAPYAEWYSKYYDAYELKEVVLKNVKSNLKGIQIKIFMATWCRDSQREVPRFLKILDFLEFPEQQLSIYNFYLDSPQYKQSPGREEKGLNIHRVPTFVFYKEGIEIGRIVESPMNSLEIDIAQILLAVPSRPKYRVVTGIERVSKEKGLAYLTEKKENLAKQTRYYAKNSFELNTYGYVLLSDNQLDKAIAVFEINAMAFPKEPNVFDSLAEAYLKAERTDLAIENYQKVLTLDEKNEQAKKMLTQLGKKLE